MNLYENKSKMQKIIYKFKESNLHVWSNSDFMEYLEGISVHFFPSKCISSLLKNINEPTALSD